MLKDIKKAFYYTTPIMPGYLSVGAAFGLVYLSTGHSPLWAVLMSVMMFAGSMQFIAVDFLRGGYGLWEMAVITFLVNMRHIFYGLSFLERFKGKTKPYMIFSLTDENYSLLCGLPVDRRTSFFIALINQLYWITGTVIGVLAGSFIKINTKGMDFAMTALFTVILTEQLKKKELRLPALFGGVCAAAALMLFGGDGMVLPAMLMLVFVLLVAQKWMKRAKKENE